MPITVEQLATEALSLSRATRAQLADRLFESLDTDDLTAMDRLWASEAKRRADELISGKVQGILGDQVFAEARRILGE